MKLYENNNIFSDIENFIEKKFGHEMLNEVKNLQPSKEDEKKYWEWISEQKIQTKHVKVNNNCKICNKLILSGFDKVRFIKNNCCEKCYSKLEGKKKIEN